MNKHIEFSLDLSATDNKIRDKGAIFASKDRGSVSILISVYKYKIKDTDEIKVLSVFENSGNRVFEDAVVLNGVARYDFDTSLITENDTVTNYVYIKSGDKEADIGGFSFDVRLSEIDRGAEIIKNHYDKNYETLLADFKNRIDGFINDLGDLNGAYEDISVIQTNIKNLSDSLNSKTDYSYVHELLLDIKLTPGPEGPQGPQGETGLQGPRGLTGPQGEIGPQGPRGYTGDSVYETWLTRPENEGKSVDEFLDSIRGEKGETGAQGVQGLQGPEGEKGEDGVGIPQTISKSGDTVTLSDMGGSISLTDYAKASQVLTNVPLDAKFTDTTYTHPSSHPASMITESSTNRFVTDTEKEHWNSKTDDAAVNAHIAEEDNPHAVTKAQVGLGNVDNVKQATKAAFDTHDADTTKHITEVERDAWNAKQDNLTAGVNVTIVDGTISAIDTVYDDSNVKSHIANKVNPHGVTKDQVGLGNVSNIAQASKTEFDSHNSDTAKHVTASERSDWNSKQNALGFTPENISNKSKANGYASLDANGKVPASELPSYVDDVVESTTLANLSTTGETGKIYVTTNDNKTYRWSGTAYVEISASLALGTTSSTAYRGDLGNTAYSHSQETGNPHGTTKAQIGLGNVDNTSDANKPVSTATQTELDKKANSSQVLTDVPANAKFTDTIYSHPSTHPASMIVETSTKRFVTDSEKAIWNAKADTSAATTLSDGLMSKEDKNKLNGIAAGAQVNRTIATQSEAESGTNNTTDMTPLRTKQAITKQAMVVVNHGTNASTERPTDALAVYWIGAVEPTNATDNDLWIGG